MRRRKLVRGPCVECGEEPALAYQAAPDRPLGVAWYCRAHHPRMGGRRK